MDNKYILISIAIMSGVTILLRVLPFVIFAGDRRTPSSIIYLGKVLPFSIMGMLVVYCLKSVDVLSGSHGIPEVIAISIVALMQFWRRNTVLSVVIGTVSYMLLVQLVF